MPLANRRVVITGIGVVTSIGMDAAAFWDGLAREQCGIKTIQAFDPTSGFVSSARNNVIPPTGFCRSDALRDGRRGRS